MTEKCAQEKKRRRVEMGRERKILRKGFPGCFASRSGQKSGGDGGTGRRGSPGRGSGKISGRKPEALHWFKPKGSMCSLARGRGSRLCLTHSGAPSPSLCALTIQVCVGEEGTPVGKWIDIPPTLRTFEGPLGEKPPLHGNVPPWDKSTTSWFCTSLGQEGPEPAPFLSALPPPQCRPTPHPGAARNHVVCPWSP